MGLAALERNGVNRILNRPPVVPEKSGCNSQTRMTNDEIRRNDEIRMTKSAIAPQRAFRHSGFGFHSSFVIRHSTTYFLSLFLAALSAAGSSATNGEDCATVIVVVGAPGEEQFGKSFEQWTALWEKASREAGAKFVVLGQRQTNAVSDLEQLKQTLAMEPKDLSSELWLVLIGHGTFDGKEARFNLRGPDFSASELEDWLKPFRRPLAVINCASSNGRFLSKLSATNRVILTATRSGYEQDYARFGQFVAEAITDP